MDEKHSISSFRMMPSKQLDRRTPGSEEDTSLQGNLKFELDNELRCVPTIEEDCLKSKRTLSQAEVDVEETTRKRVRVDSGDSERGTKEVITRQIGSPTYVSSEEDSSNENLSLKYSVSGAKVEAAAVGSADDEFHGKVKKFRKTKSSTGDDDKSTEESEDDGIRCDENGINDKGQFCVDQPLR